MTEKGRLSRGPRDSVVDNYMHFVLRARHPPGNPREPKLPSGRIGEAS